MAELSVGDLADQTVELMELDSAGSWASPLADCLAARKVAQKVAQTDGSMVALTVY